ncbi:MAG: SAM-dependent methyltransferase [Paenibacillus sp.]|jgi:ubiquinone/menaquinone biosynthesis C-methylase UbiE|uniref:class I SAM-dependent methyltransferase n=1 Tax=Paenibacillus sp. GCM10012303 TaxID=3317340 RepID=UPI0029EAB227|nr:SAM-dependent methyltransferase [Paenibacillus sp.]
MADHASIYAGQADVYEEMIAKQPDLSGVLEEIRPFDGLDAADVGAGTGRLSAVLGPRVRSLAAFDASTAMLDVLAGKLHSRGLTNWRTEQADHRKLPLADKSVDLIVSGWSVSYLCSSDVPGYRSHVHEIIGEMKRTLRPGGTIVLFETMGTGTATPAPPRFLLDYYEALEQELGFSHRWIRTDYTFGSLAEAERLTRFFFGSELAAQVVRNGWTVVPECAGIWWLHV